MCGIHNSPGSATVHTTDWGTFATTPLEHQKQPCAAMTLNVVVNHEWCQRAQSRHREKLNLFVLSGRPVTCWHRCQRRPNCLVCFYVWKQRQQHIHLRVNLQQRKRDKWLTGLILPNSDKNDITKLKLYENNHTNIIIYKTFYFIMP